MEYPLRTLVRRACTVQSLGHLVMDPCVHFLHAVTEPGGRFPAQNLSDFGVVAAAAPDAHGRPGFVDSPNTDTGDLLDDLHQLVDGNQFGASDVYRVCHAAFEEFLRSFEAVVDVSETPGLFAVPPDLDLMPAGQLGRHDFLQMAAGAFSRPPLNAPCGP